ncbi:hypothetical protein V8G54_026831 [Vigna mungo]|uniref:Uncharacterized protein n=1 Tax=Vigna mungo TaxID=3915 RepID=A0AAQ3N142_VIGMU
MVWSLSSVNLRTFSRSSFSSCLASAHSFSNFLIYSSCLTLSAALASSRTSSVLCMVPKLACKRCTLSDKLRTSSDALFSAFDMISFSCFKTEISIISFRESSSAAINDSELSRSFRW